MAQGNFKEQDFKGRATEPKAIMQNMKSFTGQGSRVSEKDNNSDGMGRFRDSPNNQILDNPGFQTGGYIDKKDLDIGGLGSDVRLNMLPPGMFIDNQKNADIRPLEVKFVTDMGYPGDGWSGPSEPLGI